MPIDPAEQIAEETERELERTVRSTARGAEAHEALARLLAAFDARRRSRDTRALLESTRVVQRH